MISEKLILLFFLNASLVQLVERRSPKSGVEGSSPSGRVFYWWFKNIKI
jgi:hypothetical protein